MVLSLLRCQEPPPPAAPSRPDAIASWDGGIVTALEVRQAVRQLGPGLKEQFDTPEGRTQFVEALVAKRLLAGEARKRGLDQDPELKRQVDELEERLLIQALLAADARTAAPPSEEQLRGWYDAHKDTFQQKPAVRVARALVLKSSPKARPRIDALRDRLQRGAAREKVMAEGEGAERTAGGDIGWLDEPSSPLATAALALTKPGEISPVVELPDAFAFVSLIERREARLPPFEEVRELVASRYAPIAQRQAFDRLVKQLFEKNSVKVNAAAIP